MRRLTRRLAGRHVALGCMAWICGLTADQVFAKRPLTDYAVPVKRASVQDASVISSATALYDLMTAEFLVQARELKAASRIYFPYAIRSSSVSLVERAASTAFLSGDLDQSSRLAHHWLHLVPQDEMAQQILITTHILDKKYAEAIRLMLKYAPKEKKEAQHLSAKDLIKVLPKAESVSPVNKSSSRAKNAAKNLLKDEQTPSQWMFGILKGVAHRSEDEDEAFSHFQGLLNAVGSSELRYPLLLDVAIWASDAKKPQYQQLGLKSAEQAMQARPALLEPAVYYALILSKEEPEKAGEWLKKTVMRYKQGESGYVMVGLMLSSRQQVGFALPVFEQGFNEYPNHPAIQILYFQTLLDAQRYDQARTLLSGILSKLDPNESRTTQLAIQFARLAKTREEREAALVFLKKVPQTDEYFETVQELILYELSDLNLSHAISYLELLEQKPFERLQGLWLLPIEVLKQQQKFSEALKIAAKGLVFHPESEDLLETKAVLLSELDRMGEAEKVWRGLIEKHPDQPSFYNNLGYVLLEKTARLDDAEVLIRKAYALAPKDTAILDSMGWVMFKRGKAKESIPYLQDALTVGGPADADVLLHLLEVYVALGDKAQQKIILDKILVLKGASWKPLIELKKRLTI